jgi:DNA-binding SARP family transcriptional activator
MKVYSAQGKPAAAKKQYEEMSSLLKSELGIEPSPESKRVFADLNK